MTTRSAGPALAPPAPAASPRLAPTRVKVCGPLHGVAFPDACARCGAPARDRLRVDKLFRHTHSESPTTYEFARLDVPFCDACRGEHARLLAPIDPRALRRLRWTFVARCLPYVIPIGVLLWMFPRVLVPVARSLGEDGATWGTAIGAAILAFFGLSLLGFVRLVLRARHDLQGDWTGLDPNDTYVRTVPILLGGTAALPERPTPVLAAANFTSDVAELFEGERHTFTFADPVFAAQFAALNADRLWDAKAPKARRARRLRHAMLIAVVAFGVYVMLMDWLAS